MGLISNKWHPWRVKFRLKILFPLKRLILKVKVVYWKLFKIPYYTYNIGAVTIITRNSHTGYSLDDIIMSNPMTIPQWTEMPPGFRAPTEEDL